jgi:hypothetical protein
MALWKVLGTWLGVLRVTLPMVMMTMTDNNASDYQTREIRSN